MPAPSGADRVLVALLLGSGIRIGSALALDVEDVDLDHGELMLRSTKGDRPTTAVLPADVTKQMRRLLAGRKAGPVFLAAGGRLSIRHAQRRFANWFAAAGIVGRTTHSLRHTFAAGLLARTGDLLLVQAAMNHASIVSTTIYTAVDREKLRAAVQM